MNANPMKKTSRHNRSERGEAEILFFGVVLIVFSLISGSLYILHWVRTTKNARVQAAQDTHIAKLKPTPFSVRKDPGEYLAHCQKDPWALLQTHIPCDVMPESYGELYLMPSNQPEE